MARHGIKTKTIGLRGRAWWALRKNKKMTLSDIQISICDGNEKNPINNLRKWLNKLVIAGLVERQRIDDGKPTSNGSYCYALVNDVGPKAPVVRGKYDEVYDPNNDVVYPLKPETESAGHENIKTVNGDAL